MKQLNWQQLSLTICTGLVGVPLLMLGVMLTAAPAHLAVINLLIPLTICFALALGMLRLINERPSTTPETIARFFGKESKYLMVGITIFSAICWLSVHTRFLDSIIQCAIPPLANLHPYAHFAVTGLILACAIRAGSTFLQILGRWALYLFGAGILIAIFYTYAYGFNSSPVPTNFSSLEYISISLSTILGTIAGMPNFYQFADSEQDRFNSVVAVQAIAIPALILFGWFLGALAGTNDILNFCLAARGYLYWWATAFFSISIISNFANSWHNALLAVADIPVLSYTPYTAALLILGIILQFIVPGAGNIIRLVELAGISGCALVVMTIIQGNMPAPLSKSVNLKLAVLATLVGIASAFGFISLSGHPTFDTFLISSVLSLGGSLLKYLIGSTYR